MIVDRVFTVIGAGFGVDGVWEDASTPDQAITVEEVLLTVGEEITCPHSRSRTGDKPAGRE